jgi:hypothetical protein
VELPRDDIWSLARNIALLGARTLLFGMAEVHPLAFALVRSKSNPKGEMPTIRRHVRFNNLKFNFCRKSLSLKALNTPSLMPP